MSFAALIPLVMTGFCLGLAVALDQMGRDWRHAATMAAFCAVIAVLLM
jgi:hypothetical protein